MIEEQAWASPGKYYEGIVLSAEILSQEESIDLRVPCMSALG